MTGLPGYVIVTSTMAYADKIHPTVDQLIDLESAILSSSMPLNAVQRARAMDVPTRRVYNWDRRIRQGDTQGLEGYIKLLNSMRAAAHDFVQSAKAFRIASGKANYMELQLAEREIIRRSKPFDTEPDPEDEDGNVESMVDAVNQVTVEKDDLIEAMSEFAGEFEVTQDVDESA